MSDNLEVKDDNKSEGNHEADKQIEEEKTVNPDGEQEENSDGPVEIEITSKYPPQPRMEEIKKIGVIQHISGIGENLKKIFDEEIRDDEKKYLYKLYSDILAEDINMINEQLSLYGEELPENVATITRPVDDNMQKVMKRCLSVIQDYMVFLQEEEHNIELIVNSFEELIQISYLLDETEDMLNVVLDSAELKTGGVIGEA